MSLFDTQLDSTLQYFSEGEQDYLLEMADFSDLKLNDEERYILLKIMQTFDDNTVQAKKDYLIDIFEKIFVRENPPSFYIANQGEDFTLTVRLRKSDDFTGTILLIRNTEDGSALSDIGLQGTSDSEQTIDITDLSLSPDNFYKLNVLTEAPNGQTEASGDALSLLDQIYLYVGENIDTI